jgi:metal-dependent hydrolase (beta-lactamase superfamily II)
MVGRPLDRGQHHVQTQLDRGPRTLSPCHCTDLAAKIALAGAAPLREVGVGLEIRYA